LSRVQNLHLVWALPDAIFELETEVIMIKKQGLLALLLILFLTYACKKTYETVPSDVVINELMPVNSTTVADNYGEYDDWIELFNLSSSAIDLSGYYLSDNHKKPSKWKIPNGTSITGKGYLIIWADGDSTQFGLHTNFKLSSEGEEAVLTKPDLTITDKISFPATTGELSYSRVPNGTGQFKWKNPTFNKSNDTK
jgi:hypothetical protein